MIQYKITNYGNTRSVYIKGQTWEIAKNQTITIDEAEIENAAEVAEAFEKLQFADVEVMEQPDKKKSKKKTSKKKKVIKKSKKKKILRWKKKTSKKKATVGKNTKKKVTTKKKSKKIKQSKYKRRSKNE